MKDSELRFDRTCHVLYSKPCKAQIQEKIALHYPPEQREDVWERVQRQYVDFFTDWSTDLGGDGLLRAVTEHPRRLGRQVHQLFHKMFHGTPRLYTLGGICILHPYGYALSRRKADLPACFFLFNLSARVSPCWRTAPRLS